MPTEPSDPRGAESSEAEQYHGINNTELRVACEARLKRFLSPWTQRALLIQFLEGGGEPPGSPVDEIRFHQAGILLNRFHIYRTSMSCDANCFAHQDVHVMECQVQNKVLRHPRFPRNP